MHTTQQTSDCCVDAILKAYYGKTIYIYSMAAIRQPYGLLLCLLCGIDMTAMTKPYSCHTDTTWFAYGYVMCLLCADLYACDMVSIWQLNDFDI